MTRHKVEQIQRSTPEMLYFLQYQASIDSMKLAPVYPDNKWLLRCEQHGLCPACRHVDRSRYPVPLDIILAEAPIIDDEVAFALATIELTVWRRSYIELLSKDLSGYVIGKCLLPDGAVLKDFVTCYGPRYIIIRGGPGSLYRECSECGTIDSKAVGTIYTLSSGLCSARVYQDAQCQFYMTEDALSEYEAQCDLPLLPKGIGVKDESPDGTHPQKDA